MACGRCEDFLCGLYAVILKYVCVVLCIHNAHAFAFSYRDCVGEQRLSNKVVDTLTLLKPWLRSRAVAGANTTLQRPSSKLLSWWASFSKSAVMVSSPTRRRCWRLAIFLTKVRYVFMSYSGCIHGARILKVVIVFCRMSLCTYIYIYTYIYKSGV